jgi:hypothetical protein
MEPKHQENMLRENIPFPEEGQIFHLVASGPDSHGLERDADFLPGCPGIPLRDRFTVRKYIERDLLTDKVDELSRMLYLAGSSSSHIRSLHHHAVQGRNIVITEQPELHLVFDDVRVFVKPLPEYLTSYKIWAEYLIADPINDSRAERQDVLRAAKGLLRTYRLLIQHQSDFRVATEKGLVPRGVTYVQFATFIAYALPITDTEVSPRYSYGDLSQSRLNLLGTLIFHNSIFQVKSNLVIGSAFVFGIISTIFSAMQVALAAPLAMGQGKSWDTFSLISRGFAICILVVLATLLLGLIFISALRQIRNVIYTMRVVSVRYRPNNPTAA